MDPSEYFILSLFIALGLFSIVAAICNFDWYFKTSGAMTFVNWFGRGGARISVSYTHLDVYKRQHKYTVSRSEILVVRDCKNDFFTAFDTQGPKKIFVIFS